MSSFAGIRPSALVALALTVAALAGCTLIETRPDPSQFYVLDAPAAPAPAPDAVAPSWGFPLAVARVRTPSYLDQPQLVSRAGGSRVTFSEFNRWMEPLDKGATRVFSGALAARLGVDRLALEPALDIYRDGVLVQVDALRLDGEIGREVVLHARWRASAVHDGSTLLAGERVVTAKCSGSDYHSYAAAMGAALDEFAARLADDLRAGVARNAAGLPVKATSSSGTK